MKLLNDLIILVKDTVECSVNKLLGHGTIDILDLMVFFMVLLVSVTVVYFTPVIAVIIMAYTTWSITQPMIKEGAEDENSNKDIICPIGD